MYEGTDPNIWMYWQVAGNTKPPTSQSNPDKDPVSPSNGIELLTDNTQTLSSADPIVGCMDTAAYNYDPSATSSCKGCCTYSAPVAEVEGCMDSGAENYDASANVQCRSCCSYPIHGCMDSEALNFDRTATVQCNSCCKYPDVALADSDDLDGSAGYGSGGYGAGIVEPTSDEGAPPKKKSKKALWIGVGLVALLLLTSKKKK